MATVVLGAPDAHELAAFYRNLLGWPVDHEQPGWVRLDPPSGGPRLAFQSEPGYVRPSWPAAPGDQQMMVHLDFRVGDLAEAGAHALACGAVEAEHQPQDDVRVHLDPAGHPFCFFEG
jgi:catechol 2,3-dioxygenase-like lactoylglutathione lyase family enzyme